ncbi:MAG: DNA polymerase III epsilon subunit-like protein [Oceanicoccus sp.]|jgi:DNA polymerase III epsilon subunit-like protein
MFICLDVETTGLNPKEDHLIEVAIVRFDYEKMYDEWSTLVKPPIPIPAFVKGLTGINDEMVADAPLLADIADIVRSKINDDEPIMGHFIFFDTGFLREHGIDLPNAELDSCQLTQALLHNEPSYSLEILVEKLGLTQPNAHRALDDVKANIELFWALCDHVRAMSNEEKEDIRPILEKSEWQWAEFILPLLDQDGGKKIEDTPMPKNVSSSEHLQLKELVETTPFLLEESSHTYQDLINYSLGLEGETLLSVPNLELMPEHPELGVLKHPTDYLEQDRLDLFLQKERLTTAETMLGMKLKLWTHKTETGDKNELRIIKSEKDIWFDVCGQENSDSESYYAKALKNAEGKRITAINHHYFLKDRSRKTPLLPAMQHIVMGEIEHLVRQLEYSWHIRLGESRFLNDLRRLKAENPKMEEIIDHIATKVAIFYGFIGMELQRYGTPKDPRHPIVIEGHHRNTSEWNRVVASASSIAAAVAALDVKESPTKDELSHYIDYLHKIVNTPSALIWMATSYDDMPLIHSFPQDTRKLFSERVWKTDAELHLFAHHADLDDDFKFIRTELALPDQMLSLSPGGPMPEPIFHSEVRIPNPKDAANVAACVKAVEAELPKTEGNVMILVTSMRVAEQFFYKFNNRMEKHDRKLFVMNMTGSLGKVVKMSEKTAGRNLFVGNEILLQRLLDENVPLTLMAVHKLPFSYPDAPIQKARSSHYGNVYKEFSLPQAKLRHQMNISKFLGNDWEGKKILLLDPRIGDLF